MNMPPTMEEREAELAALQSAFDEYIASSRELEEELDAELAKMRKFVDVIVKRDWLSYESKRLTFLIDRNDATILLQRKSSPIHPRLMLPCRVNSKTLLPSWPVSKRHSVTVGPN